MKILGVNLGYMATACLLEDGEIKFCVSEERFSRKKNDESYPKKSIETCLSSSYSNKDLDYVAVGSLMPDLWHRLTHYYSTFSIKDRLEEQYKYWKPVLYENKKIAWQSLYEDRLDFDQYPGNWKELTNSLSNEYYLADEDKDAVNNHIKNTISDHIGIDKQKIVFLDHHSCHSSYAYYSSPSKDKPILVFTLDAFGDGNSATISIGFNGKLERKKTISHSDFQIARIYRYITLLMGMKPDEHEYKIMGLAPYAKEKIYLPALEVFKDTMYVDGLDFKFKSRPKDMYFYFKEKLEGIRFDGIAGGLQLFVEDLIEEWVTNAINEFQIYDLCFAGGVCMNIKALQKVANIEKVQSIHVPPSPGDDSLSMGAAYYLHSIKSKEPIHSLKNAYLGPSNTLEDINKIVELASIKGYTIIKNVTSNQIASKLSEGRVIGRCVGQMEFGARALGNRSILADPRTSKMIRKINEKIKNRDFWMPFAPAILSDFANLYLSNPKDIISPFMTLGFDTLPEKRDSIIAGLHPADFTARPQFVEKSKNELFYDLIYNFYLLTEVPCLLNTSFNLHGEPIVNTALDAFRVFELTDIDDLVLEGVIVSKKI